MGVPGARGLPGGSISSSLPEPLTGLPGMREGVPGPSAGVVAPDSTSESGAVCSSSIASSAACCQLQSTASLLWVFCRSSASMDPSTQSANYQWHAQALAISC